MFDKPLINMMGESKKYIFGNVFFQWLSLLSNIGIILLTVRLLMDIVENQISLRNSGLLLLAIFLLLLFKFFSMMKANKMSFFASKDVKKVLREKIYKKILGIGASYNEKVSTGEILQVTVEGVEQLEVYFGSYLPQLLYSLAASLTLFLVISLIDVPTAVILLIGVPLIPLSIMGVQRIAKNLLGKYWDQYSNLGEKFLENIQGLNTLKIYQADEKKNEEMNVEAEKFRKVTMKVLTLQLNSIGVMDLIAFGGAALGIAVGLFRYGLGHISFAGALIIILLTADFFIPMRVLGSYFHVAMNGLAASKKIFKLLDIKEEKVRDKTFPEDFKGIYFKDMSFSYDGNKKILDKVNIGILKKGLTAIVGESGSGKSTIASLLTGKNTGYQGSIKIGDIELEDIREKELLENITYVGNNPYIFKGRVRDNLLMGKAKATDEELWEALRQVSLKEFIENQGGLDILLEEKGSNFSGGQRQRLAIARALLHNSPIYIFDESTSNIDVESELEINKLIAFLAESKTIVYISHRLANIVKADMIYVLEDGEVGEYGSHEKLALSKGLYQKLWQVQSSLEKYASEEV